MPRYVCQECGRPAHFEASTRNGKITGNSAHDLCRRCWARLMTAVRAAEAAAVDLEELTLP
jgi:hypothetical protein